MKTFFYLCIASALLISCNSSDNNSPAVDPIIGDLIIGEWQLQSEQENGKDITTECAMKSTFTFLENGTFIKVYRYAKEGIDACISDSRAGTWENLGNSVYKIQQDSYTLDLVFSENKTVFTYFPVKNVNYKYTFKKNSDNNSPAEDPIIGDLIIGEWQLQSEQENGKDITTKCTMKSTFTFLENGTFITVYRYAKEGIGACISNSRAGTWENLGNSVYKIQQDENTLAVVFSENKTVFTWIPEKNVEKDLNFKVTYKKNNP